MTKSRNGKSMRAVNKYGLALTIAATGAAAIWASHALAQTGAAPGPFTEAQAQAGQALYKTRCAGCHDGGGETGPLSGPGFLSVWKGGSTHDLYTRIKTTMPLTTPGSLSDAEAASAVAYVLASNGAKAGTSEFAPATSVPIASITQAGGTRRDPYAGYTSLTKAAGGTGITFPGTVAHYT